MPVLLAYRLLRKASEWVLAYYSEVLVRGQENVPKDGPLIIAACHHNELLDIATLAVTIPQRRPLRFWAKDSLFNVPIIRSIVDSSGALPVHRKDVNESQQLPKSSNTHEVLFKETVAALNAGEVIGLFPEGTTSTHPHMIPLKPGAARVALEYAAPEGESEHLMRRELRIVPVGIVWTDKSRFQSRVCVSYGRPIELTRFVSRYLMGDPREAAQLLTLEIERAMRELTINAPDWDVYYAACIARDIACEDHELDFLRLFVPITQKFIDAFIDGTAETQKAVALLLKYYSLLHYTGISHSSLSNLYHYPSDFLGLRLAIIPSTLTTTSVFLRQLTFMILHPRFLLFIPPALVHLPAYLVGYLGGKLLASPEYDETQAQWKALCGGIGFGLTSAVVSWKLYHSTFLPLFWKAVAKASIELPAWMLRLDGRIIRYAGLAATMYGFSWMMFRWHHALVARNLTQFRRLTTSFKVLHGLLPPTPQVPTDLELMAASRPPLKRISPFIIGSITQDDVPNIHATEGLRLDDRRGGLPGTRALILPLLTARAEATAVVKELMDKSLELQIILDRH